MKLNNKIKLHFMAPSVCVDRSFFNKNFIRYYSFLGAFLAFSLLFVFSCSKEEDDSNNSKDNVSDTTGPDDDGKSDLGIIEIEILPQMPVVDTPIDGPSLFSVLTPKRALGSIYSFPIWPYKAPQLAVLEKTLNCVELLQEMRSKTLPSTDNFPLKILGPMARIEVSPGQDCVWNKGMYFSGSALSNSGTLDFEIQVDDLSVIGGSGTYQKTIHLLSKSGGRASSRQIGGVAMGTFTAFEIKLYTNYERLASPFPFAPSIIPGDKECKGKITLEKLTRANVRKRASYLVAFIHRDGSSSHLEITSNIAHVQWLKIVLFLVDDGQDENGDSKTDPFSKSASTTWEVMKIQGNRNLDLAGLVMVANRHLLPSSPGAEINVNGDNKREGGKDYRVVSFKLNGNDGSKIAFPTESGDTSSTWSNTNEQFPQAVQIAYETLYSDADKNTHCARFTQPLANR